MTSLHVRKISKPSKTPGGIADSIPALHPDNLENINFVSYTAIPRDLNDAGGIEEWKERAGFIEADLQWLLDQPHDKFWCQAVFNMSLQRCITSFLKATRRSYDATTGEDLPKEIKTTLDSLLHLFFLVCLRMSTHKESKECFIDAKVFGDIIYENFLFDIPRLFDICAIYGAENGALVEKIIENIFKQQPKYHNDLKATVPTLLQVFDAICDKCGVHRSEDIGSPPRLSENNGAQSALVCMSAEQFEDIILYLSDMTHSLLAFLDRYSAGAVDLSVQKFPVKLAEKYEVLTCAFGHAFAVRDKVFHISIDKLKVIVREAQCCMLNIFQRIVFNTYLAPLLNSDRDVTDQVEQYIHLLTSVLGYKRFLAHHRTLHPFSIERDLISQCDKCNIDEARLDYIEEAADRACSVLSNNLKADESRFEKLAKSVANSDLMSDSAGGGYDVDNDDGGAVLGACAAPISGVELESLISSVHDLLPELGEGFIKLCLEEYNYDSEQLVNALLEGKLRPSLLDVDRKLSLVAAALKEEDEIVAQNPLISNRRNIYDNDEFDVLRHDIDQSRVHIGKKQRVPQGSSSATKAFLDDKSTIDKLKPLYEKYGNEFVESMYDKDIEYEDVYEDEYDDTYDSNPVGVIDADSADELTSDFRRRNERIVEQHNRDSPIDQSVNKQRDLFLEDPAELRRIREEKYAAREAMRHQRKPGKAPPRTETQAKEGSGESKPGGKTYDVKGGPKGQGQSADVLHNRAWKEKHKSSSVNHNRRALADRKRQF